METENKKLIVVLGMHRSGTSAITRGLQVMGVGLGDRLMAPMEDVNAKGFWEDIDLNSLNIEILKAIERDWHHLAPIEISHIEKLRNEGYLLRAVELLRQKISSAPIFGFKDPRVAKLLPFWKEAFSHCQFKVNYVLAMRHPLSVVKSLAKRDGIAAEQSYLLWLGHVITSLTGSAGDKRVLVDYDRLMQSPDGELMRIAKSMDLKIDPAELQSYKTEFLDPELRHTVYDLNDLLLDNACPPIVREVYTALLDVASDKARFEDVELQNKIVRWSAEYERIKSPLLLADRLSTQKAVAMHAVAERDGQIAGLNQAVAERDGQIVRLISSNSWRLTRPLRFLGRVLREELKIEIAPFTGIYLANIATVMRQARNVARYVVRGDFDGLTKQIRLRKQISLARKQQAAAATIQHATTTSLEQKRWGIMTTQHTLFIAHLIADHLRGHGWQVDIYTVVPKEFNHDWYIVICPQMFTKLPPGEKRIAYQLEQSVSSRWFTTDYFKTLENSLAVLEYSLVNIEYMTSKGVAYPLVHYLPVGALANYGDTVRASNKTYDILFYGDSKSSLRRREMLNALKQQHYNVRVVDEVFGLGMMETIKQARLVINLHYYENALLEMPRIQECLSLGVPVVTESAQDQEDYPELAGGVLFFEQGSISAMLNAVKTALEDPVPTVLIEESVAQSEQRFAFMLDRFLVAMGYLPASHVSHMSLPVPNAADRIALSLPETIVRRRIFEKVRAAVDCVVFDGIRRCPGWVGCGLSYLSLAKHARKQGLSRLTVMEDDVLLPPDFEVKMAVVQEFLDARPGKWDVFSGLIASLHPDTEIFSVEIFKDITFVTINKMTSMVYNIYSEEALNLLASWDPENQNADSNTIDKYIESQADLRVVVTLPFFVGHREEVHSTLWGFQNTQYNDMIASSEQSLKSMILNP